VNDGSARGLDHVVLPSRFLHDRVAVAACPATASARFPCAAPGQRMASFTCKAPPLCRARAAAAAARFVKAQHSCGWVIFGKDRLWRVKRHRTLHGHPPCYASEAAQTPLIAQNGRRAAAIPSQSAVPAALIAASAGRAPCPAPDLAAGCPDGTLLATSANGHLQALCRSVEPAARGGEIDVVAFPH
jgi:hypothetical protein